MLRLNRRLGPFRRCRWFNALQIRGQGRVPRALIPRAFGVNRRRVRRIFNAPGRSREYGVLLDHQRPMENITLDRTAVLQLDADGPDRSLHAAADRDVLRDDAALDLCAIADQEIRGAQLAFDSAEDLHWTIAFDIADDRHARANARACPRFRHRFAAWRVLNDGAFRLHG